MIKIELNQSKLPHHTSIDAVLLVGYQPKSILQKKMIEKGIINLHNEKCNKFYGQISFRPTNVMEETLNDPFSNLPVSVFIVNILFKIC